MGERIQDKFWVKNIKDKNSNKKNWSKNIFLKKNLYQKKNLV